LNLGNNAWNPHLLAARYNNDASAHAPKDAGGQLFVHMAQHAYPGKPKALHAPTYSQASVIYQLHTV
jgi:hypothetical protein